MTTSNPHRDECTEHDCAAFDPCNRPGCPHCDVQDESKCSCGRTYDSPEHAKFGVCESCDIEQELAAYKEYEDDGPTLTEQMQVARFWWAVRQDLDNLGREW